MLAHEPQGVLLLVDDEPNVIAALRRTFRRDGYRLLTAPGGRAGLEVLANERADLIISDMRMPEMDGVCFLGLAAALQPDTVRILLSGYADPPAVREACERGHVHRALAKPWDDDELRLVVWHALDGKRRNESLRDGPAHGHRPAAAESDFERF